MASHPEKWNKINKSGEHERDDKQGDEVENNPNDPLFFLDAQGTSELLHQCEVCFYDILNHPTRYQIPKAAYV